MYQVQGVNKYGQVYTNKGQIEHYSESQVPCVFDFDSLCSARKFTKSFVRRYPHVVCQILTNENQILEIYRDEEYWAWQERNSTDWKQTHRKMNKLTFVASSAGLVMLSMCVTIFTYVLNAQELSLALQIILTSSCCLILWILLNIKKII